ncbi:MAG: sensor histidine kinase N-terminal domain-containing protein, partial [Aestuariivirga sp.]
MLLPLLAVAMFNVWTSYRDAQTLADLTTDHALVASARVIAENIYASDGAIEANIPPSALELFVSDTPDDVAYQVKAPDGHLLAGNPDLNPPHDAVVDFAPIYFVTSYRGNLVRAVALGQPIVA